jgi:hypothetical protein
MHGGNLALVLLRVQGDSTFWIGMVRFELTTYRLPDDCANQTALHPDRAPARFDPSEGRCERKRSRVGRASRPCLLEPLSADRMRVFGNEVTDRLTSHKFQTKDSNLN